MKFAEPTPPLTRKRRGDLPVRLLCRVLEVAASGYYRWRAQPRSRRQDEDEVLAEQIAEAHRQSRNTYGARRIVDKLHDERSEQPSPVRAPDAHQRSARPQKEPPVSSHDR